MYMLENDRVRITVTSKGAEWQSFTDLRDGQEYLWNGDPAVWGRKSPVLFPIVGALKNNTFLYKGQPFMLPRHGFARDSPFRLTERGSDRLSFLLTSDSSTLKSYPFSFALGIHYQLQNEGLSVKYEVVNTGDDKLFFSIGGHPAFSVPIFKEDTFNDYMLVFEQAENADRWPVSAERGGLIELTPKTCMQHTDTLPLTRSLFDDDAIVFKNLHSKKVRLISRKKKRGLEFDFSGFPYLGIWSAPGGDFVCIEPWCGLADSVNTNQDITVKEGINLLTTGQSFERTWSVSLL